VDEKCWRLHGMHRGRGLQPPSPMMDPPLAGVACCCCGGGGTPGGQHGIASSSQAEKATSEH